ncbi:MAG: hypothetical protein KIS73_08850 [Enhydrobacter sp.]|nr:hypothetical protein [Enhydrobacter sp.]
MKATLPLGLLVSSLALAGCVQQTAPKAMPGPVLSVQEAKVYYAEQRKNELLRDLATCESGGHGESDRLIVGGRGRYIGRFQFSPPTVVAYVRQKEGRELSLAEAKELAHDWEQASELAKYMIFDLDRAGDWPLCARKLGLRQQVEEIRSAL